MLGIGCNLVIDFLLFYHLSAIMEKNIFLFPLSSAKIIGTCSIQIGNLLANTSLTFIMQQYIAAANPSY